MDALDHGKHLLAAILPAGGDAGRKDLLEVALHQLALDHFIDPQQQVLFQILEWYFNNVGAVAPSSAVGDFLREQPPGTALQYEEYYQALQALPASGEEFTHHIEQLKALAEYRRTGEAFAQGMEILQRGATHEREFIRGASAARSHVLAKFAEAEHLAGMSASPEGDMRAEAMEIMADYANRRLQRARGFGEVKTGISKLDEALGGGMQAGELVLVAANTSVGKSSMCADWIWRTCVLHGKNVVVFTSETNRVQMRFKVLARHSRWLARESGLVEADRLPDEVRDGINTRDLRGGCLRNPVSEQFLAAAVRNFTDNPAHGRCWIAQVPKQATIGTLEARLARVSRMFTADLIVIDYLMLLRSDRRRQSRREELSDIVVAAKEMASGYDNGKGAVVVSPWQMNRAGNKAAVEVRGHYLPEDLAETAESSTTADVILGLLPDGEPPERSRGRAEPLKLGCVKVRDGERLREQIKLTADYATCAFTEQAASAGEAMLMSFGGEAPGG